MNKSQEATDGEKKRKKFTRVGNSIISWGLLDKSQLHWHDDVPITDAHHDVIRIRREVAKSVRNQ
jgi:hypothetical protein